MSDRDLERLKQATARAEYILGAYLRQFPDGPFARHLKKFPVSSLEAFLLLKEMTRDGKTGLLRSELLAWSLEYALENARQHQQPFSLGIFDLDHFKQHNERLGHTGADQVLRQVAESLVLHVRANDDVLDVEQHEQVIRWGGEEFVIFFTNATGEQAQRVGHRLCSAIRELGVTISGGVAEWVDGEKPTNLLRRADKAVHQAKENGRDRVEIAAAETLDS